MSEYHAAGAAAAAFMIRMGSFKYVHYVGMPPQLFDLAADPQETRDLGQDPGYRGVVAEAEAALRKVVDPEAADRQARADQKPPKSRSSAAARRSLPAAPSAIRRYPAPSPCIRRKLQATDRLRAQPR